MNILVIYPPCRESTTPSLPLGLLYVIQPLVSDGHNVQFFDIALEKPSRSDVIKKIKSTDFDLLMIGGIVTTYSYIKWLTREVKKIYPNIPIISGGLVSAPIPHIIFANSDIDVICNGEGDITAKAYVSALERGDDISSIPGLFIKKGEQFISTPERPLIKDLDDIPPPLDAYKLLDIERYIVEKGAPLKSLYESCNTWDLNNEEGRYFAVLSGRGCVGKCTFCYRMIKGMRKHSASYVIDHMKYLVDNYAVNLFEFQDELFVGNKKWVDDFCELLKQSNMDIRFQASSRANLINDEILTKLKSVGCFDINVGFESGSQAMLDYMKKQINVKYNYSAYKLLNKFKMIPSGVPTLLGMPSETHETIKETLRFINECNIESASNYFATPYPNSELYKYALDKKLIRDEDQYLEFISDSDAGEFKINLTSLSDTQLKYFRFLLNDACKRNKLKNQINDGNADTIDYLKFLGRHFIVKIMFKIGLFKLAWKLNNRLFNRKKIQI